MNRQPAPEPEQQELEQLLTTIPEGWSRIEIHGQVWGVTRATHTGDKIISLTAERLDDTDQLGANVWLTSKGPVLRPCEVPAATVMQFLRATAEASAVDALQTEPASSSRRPALHADHRR